MMEKNNLIKISVDTLGSETSIANIIKGLNNSLLRNDNYFFRLYGSTNEITNELKNYNDLKKNVEIIDCKEMVKMTDNQVMLLSQRKILQCIGLLSL